MKADIPYLFITFIGAVTILLLRYGMPSKDDLHETIDLLNTKGGIIALLWVTSMIFFIVGMRLVYWGENMIVDHKLDTDNALILSAFNWITGAAFGGAFGAMIKTMTGDEKRPDKPEKPPEA